MLFFGFLLAITVPKFESRLMKNSLYWTNEPLVISGDLNINLSQNLLSRFVMVLANFLTNMPFFFPFSLLPLRAEMEGGLLECSPPRQVVENPEHSQGTG